MKIPPTDRHLDLGCGSAPRNPYGRRLLCGIDLRELPARPGVELRAANVVLDPIPYPNDHFDSVSAFDFFEHVPRLLTTPDGRATWFPFIRLMDKVWRVLAPGGRLYAMTPAYPSPDAFVDPTHVNLITDQTHRYFCGDQPTARMYGFEGRFRTLRAEWAVFKDATTATPTRTLRQQIRHWDHRRRGRLSHVLWELEAVKPVGTP